MADLYKVVYPASGGQIQKTLFVTATSLANALAAVKSNDTAHKIDTQHVTAVVLHHNVIAGS
jgi:hypothetical protein